MKKGAETRRKMIVRVVAGILVLMMIVMLFSVLMFR